GTASGRMFTFASALAIASAAGCINGQWNGADTDKGMARLTPLALAIAGTRSIALLAPESTTCPGALSLATTQTSSPAASLATASATSMSAPIKAVIAP